MDLNDIYNQHARDFNQRNHEKYLAKQEATISQRQHSELMQIENQKVLTQKELIAAIRQMKDENTRFAEEQRKQRDKQAKATKRNFVISISLNIISVSAAIIAAIASIIVACG